MYVNKHTDCFEYTITSDFSSSLKFTEEETVYMLGYELGDVAHVLHNESMCRSMPCSVLP